jgi:hypothetical protein
MKNAWHLLVACSTLVLSSCATIGRLTCSREIPVRPELEECVGIDGKLSCFDPRKPEGIGSGKSQEVRKLQNDVCRNPTDNAAFETWIQDVLNQARSP